MTDQIDLIKAIGTKFIQRRDVKAAQGEADFKGDIIPWQPIKTPFKVQDFVDHLNGTRSFGHYVVDSNNKCKLFAFDIDMNIKGKLITPDESIIPCNPREVFLDLTHWGRPQLIQEIKAMAEGLAYRIDTLLGISTAIHFSGNKGLHVYGFTGETDAVFAREAAKGVLDSFGCFEAFRGENFFRHITSYENISIEIFPKQDKLSNPDGYGNLLALPLGVHKVSGMKKMFVSTKGSPDSLEELDPSKALSGDAPWE